MSQLGDQTLPEYQERVNVLSGEIQRLNEVIAQKHVDVGEVSKQLHNKSKQLEEASAMSKTSDTLQDQITKLAHEKDHMNNELRRVTTQFNTTSQQNEEMKSMIESLNKQLRRAQGEGRNTEEALTKEC